MSDILEFMSGGASANEKLVDKIYDKEDEVIDAKAKVLAKTGQYSKDELDEMIKNDKAEIAKGREDAMSDAKKATRNSVLINSAGAILSTGLAVGATGAGSVIKGATSKVTGKVTSGVRKVANNVKTAVLKTDVGGKIVKSNIGNTAIRIGKGTASVMKKGASVTWDATTKIGGKVKNIKPKSGAGLGKNVAAFGVKSAIITSPFLATQYITRSAASKEADHLNATLEVLNGSYNYIIENGDKFAGECKDACKNFAESYSTSCYDLKSQYEAGTLSQSEYNEKMKEMSETYSEELDNLKKDFPEMLETNAYAEGMINIKNINKNIDLDRVVEKSSWLTENDNEHSEIKENLDDYRKAKWGTAESSFGNFWKTLNSTVIKYVPAVAYVEAAFVKVADSTFDFVRDSLTGSDEPSKHQNDTITGLAKEFIKDSEEHLAVKSDAKEAIGELQSNVATLDEYKDTNKATLLMLENENNSKSDEKENIDLDYA